MTPIIDADAEQERAAYIPPAVCEPIIYAVENVGTPRDVIFLGRHIVLGTKKNKEIAILVDRKLIFDPNAGEEIRRRILEAEARWNIDEIMKDIPVLEERVILSNPRVSEMFSELMRAASDDRD